MMFDIRPLRNEDDYDKALAAITVHFDNEPVPVSVEADHFELLALVIADYEAKHWAIEAPDTPDLLRTWMEQKGMKQSDLATLLGSKARASEILNHRRHLTPQQAWKLHKEWHIPTDALIRPYPLRPTRNQEHTINEGTSQSLYQAGAKSPLPPFSKGGQM